MEKITTINLQYGSKQSDCSRTCQKKTKMENQNGEIKRGCGWVKKKGENSSL